GLCREFRIHGGNPVASTQREHRGQVRWNRHTGDDIHVKSATCIKGVANTVVVSRPGKLELAGGGITWLTLRRQDLLCAGKPPVPLLGSQFRLARRRMNVCGKRLIWDLVKVFERGVVLWHHDEIRSFGVRPQPEYV